jgi:cytochrome subunit of sulfide dehydrogenase
MRIDGLRLQWRQRLQSTSSHQPTQSPMSTFTSKTLAAAAMAAFALVAQGAHAQTSTPAQTLHTRALAATCANCHGTDGRAVEGQPMVRLAGYPKDAMVTQLRAFRDGTRPATVMHQLVKGYSDAQIDAIGTYFAAQK